MDKKALSERDICTKFITPALESAGWDMMEQVREEVSFVSSFNGDGVLSHEAMEILKIQPIHQIGTPTEIVEAFGGKPAYEQAIRELEAELHSEVIQ